MKNNIHVYIKHFLIILLIVQTSCKKDFLDTPPTSSPVRQDYVTSLATCEEYLNGIYIDLTINVCVSSVAIYPDLIADNIKPKIGGSILNAQYSWQQIASDDVTSGAPFSTSHMNGFWTGAYKVIRSCDYLLENIERFHNENPVKADNIRGQCLAIRALVHHNLLNVFAQPYKFTSDASHPGIPFIETSDYIKPVSRQTVGEVYAAIIDDLNMAIKLLPSAASNTIFIGANAAKAILARVYLFKGDYIKAKDFAVDVAKSVPISKTDYPNNLFTPNDEEALFQVPPAVTATGGYNIRFASFLFRSNQFYATSDIVDLLLERPNDLRKTWVTMSGSNWTITKFPVGVVPDVPVPNTAYYHSIVRSSEMYLTAAESYAEIGNRDSAIFYLDAIRQRADMTASSTIASGKALVDSIYKERRKELCFEGLRMFDLLRAGKGVDRNDAINPEAQILPYPSSKAIAPIHGFDVRYYGLGQNVGY